MLFATRRANEVRGLKQSMLQRETIGLLESAELLTRRSEVLFWFRLFRDAFQRVNLGQ